MNRLSDIDQLIYLFSKLPGLGQRSARRIVLHLLQDKDLRLNGLIEGLSQAVNNINKCRICGNIDSYDICGICNNHERDGTVIAVVETVAELWAIERSGTFSGKYHVLSSSNTIAKQTPDDLKLPSLSARCLENKVQELIIATNATLEGQTLGYFITEYFKDHTIKVSRLASGVPIGGELDYLDEGTLSAAIALRQPFG